MVGPTLQGNGGQQKTVTHPTRKEWWATKNRYPPYKKGMVGNKKPLPTLQGNGGQQKTVNPPYRGMVGNKKPLPTLQERNGGQQKTVTHPTRKEWWAIKTNYIFRYKKVFTHYLPIAK